MGGEWATAQAVPLPLEVVPLEGVLLEELLEAAPIQAFPLLASSHVNGET